MLLASNIAGYGNEGVALCFHWLSCRMYVVFYCGIARLCSTSCVTALRIGSHILRIDGHWPHEHTCRFGIEIEQITGSFLVVLRLIILGQLMYSQCFLCSSVLVLVCVCFCYYRGKMFVRHCARLFLSTSGHTHLFRATDFVHCVSLLHKRSL